MNLIFIFDNIPFYTKKEWNTYTFVGDNMNMLEYGSIGLGPAISSSSSGGFSSFFFLLRLGLGGRATSFLDIPATSYNYFLCMSMLGN